MLNDLMVIHAKGGDLEFRDHNGATPLHIASANGYLSVVEFLLDNHVSTEVTDEDLWQPIHAAACWGHLEVVELLAQNGADVNACTRNGETPFDICEDPEIKDRLIQLKEQRLLLERPKVRRSRSASTRTQSIRRTSLREKMNTTKRDVQDEKLYFIQNFDTNSKQVRSSFVLLLWRKCTLFLFLSPTHFQTFLESSHISIKCYLWYVLFLVSSCRELATDDCSRVISFKSCRLALVHFLPFSN